jgi:catechol 2,3-dioxygenase-like lactoylglutathione lyase family enzyme
MAKLRVVEMDHIVLNVRDVERSLGFYTDVLGLQGERLEEYRAGKVGFPSVRINTDTLIDLMVGDGTAGTPNLNHYCLVCEATDLGVLADSLAAQGVRVIQTPVSRWGAHGQATSIYILDPDDNQIELRCY